MAVSFVAAGASAADTTGAASLTPTPPTHTTDDILLAAMWNEGGSKPSTATAGWNEIATVSGTNDATWAWKRATAAGTAGPTITAADTDCFGIVFAIRGCVTSITPFVDATTSGDGGTTDTTPDTALITTTNVNQMAMAFLCQADDVGFASGNPPSTWTSDANVLDNSGTDAGFHVISKTIAAPGDVASVVIGTFTAGVAYACLTLAWIPNPTAAITGTITSGTTEAHIVTGGRTLIITLTDDTWIAAGVGSFDLQRDEIIAGIDSAQSEATGWDLVPKATQSLTGVVRTSDSVVTITWDAFPTYNITAQETITVTIPATAVVSGVSPTIAAATFTIAVSLPPPIKQMHHYKQLGGNH